MWQYNINCTCARASTHARKMLTTMTLGELPYRAGLLAFTRGLPLVARGESDTGRQTGRQTRTHTQ